jgi:hypothetical protein
MHKIERASTERDGWVINRRSPVMNEIIKTMDPAAMWAGICPSGKMRKGGHIAA